MFQFRLAYSNASHASLLAFLVSLPLALAPKCEADDNYSDRQIHQWTVHVRNDLQRTVPRQTTKALELLESQLLGITQKLPREAVTELRKVELWFSPKYVGFQERAEYHPNADWLKQNNRNPAMAKGVEFSNISIFEAETRRMPNFALHELAHAYHDRVLGVEEPKLKKAFEEAKRSGNYNRVARRDANGKVTYQTAYAMTNVNEFFAECSEAFYSTNDFFPFNNVELKEIDPAAHSLIAELWNSTPNRDKQVPD